jgi:hypothetical protein
LDVFQGHHGTRACVARPARRATSDLLAQQLKVSQCPREARGTLPCRCHYLCTQRRTPPEGCPAPTV